MLFRIMLEGKRLLATQPWKSPPGLAPGGLLVLQR
jgi:hypothetical protein